MGNLSDYSNEDFFGPQVGESSDIVGNMKQNELDEAIKRALKQAFGESSTQLDGKPRDLRFNSQLKGDSTIRDSLALRNNVDTRALERMRQEGLRDPGQASAWRNLIDQQITRQAGDVGIQQQQAQQQALDNMAMRGGVSQGAQERLMQAGVGQNLAAQQNIFSNRLNADLQDEQMRQQQLGNLQQQEMAFGGMQNALDAENRNAAQSELLQKRAFDVNQYNEKMRAWAAQKTAAATPSGGGGKK